MAHCLASRQRPHGSRWSQPSFLGPSDLFSGPSQVGGYAWAFFGNRLLAVLGQTVQCGIVESKTGCTHESVARLSCSARWLAPWLLAGWPPSPCDASQWQNGGEKRFLARCLNLAQLCEASGDRSHMAPVTRMSPAVLSSDCEGFLDQLRYFHWLSSLPLGAMWLSLAVLVQCGKGAASYGNAVF